MTKCEWALLCDYAFLDVGRKMCVIGIFDRIYALNVPATHHQAALAMKLVGEPKEKVKLKIEIVRPTGGVLARVEGSGELSETGTAEIQFNVGNLLLPDWGIYAFNVYIGDELAKPIGIMVTRPPQQPTSQP